MGQGCVAGRQSCFGDRTRRANGRNRHAVRDIDGRDSRNRMAARVGHRVPELQFKHIAGRIGAAGMVESSELGEGVRAGRGVEYQREDRDAISDAGDGLAVLGDDNGNAAGSQP